jgi:hypothetical protein
LIFNPNWSLISAATEPWQARPRLATTHRNQTARHDRIGFYKKTERHSAWPVHSHTEKEKEMSHANLSRRAIVAGAASMPALALPFAANAVGNPDAELVELSQELTRLWPAFAAARDESSAMNMATYDLLRQRFGSLDSLPKETFHAEALKVEAETGADIVNEKYEPLQAQIFDIREKIALLPARSLAGLRAKAVLAINVHYHLWESPAGDLDWDEGITRALIEAVCTVTDLDVPLAVQS